MARSGKGAIAYRVRSGGTLMPTKPKAKKKRGIVLEVERGIFRSRTIWMLFTYPQLRRAGLPELKPGESVKVRVVIESV